MLEHFAYLDPSTGSLFVQVIIGGLLAGTVVLRSYVRTVVDRVKVVVHRQAGASK